MSIFSRPFVQLSFNQLKKKIRSYHKLLNSKFEAYFLWNVILRILHTGVILQLFTVVIATIQYHTKLMDIFWVQLNLRRTISDSLIIYKGFNEKNIRYTTSGVTIFIFQSYICGSVIAYFFPYSTQTH